MGGFEIFEHTADVGIRAWGSTLEQCFEQATRGLLDITDAWRPGEGERAEIAVDGRDLVSVLVDWLSEVLYLQDTRDIVVTDISVVHVEERGAKGWLALRPRTDELEGTAVKAITYHGLSVDKTDEVWTTQVIVDV